MANVQYKIGTGLLHRLTIKNTLTPSTTIAIKPLAIELSYYETVMSISKSMTISLIDSTDLQYSLPLVGGEEVAYNFSDSSNIHELSGTMRLYKLSGGMRLKRGVDSYNLFLTTEEQYRDFYTAVNQSMGPDSARDIIAQIFKSTIGKTSNKKLITLDETRGLHQFVFPRISPFSAINLVTKEASSDKLNTSSYMVFFENNEGYHFTSIENLFSKPVSATYIYTEDQITGDTEIEDKRMISYSHDQSFDVLNGIAKGQFGSRVSRIDMLTKSISTDEYSYKNDFNTIERMGGTNKTISAAIENEIGIKPVREKFIISNESSPNSPYVSGQGQSQMVSVRKHNDNSNEISARAQLSNNVLKCAVYGNSKLRAGQTVQLIIPATGVRTISDISNNTLSGKYLITELCHRFTPQDDKYITTMNCVRDSFNEPIESGRF